MFGAINRLLRPSRISDIGPVEIVFKGPVIVGWQSYDGSESREIKDIETLKTFDGLVYMDDQTNEAEELSEYLQDGDDTAYLFDLGVRGGVLSYKYEATKKQLFISITLQ